MGRLLVTGGAGFIGSNFVHYWLQYHASDTVVVLDALTYAGNKHNLDSCQGNANYFFIHGSINDQTLVEQLLEQHSIDTIVHFAAESHVDRSISGPDAFLDTNILGTHSLLKAARKVWTATGGFAGKRFHHVSTDEVYGTLGPQDPAFTETTPYAPNSHIVRAYHHTFGLPVTTSNCSNNYGPFQFPEKLLPLCLLNILQGKPLPIYGDGMQIRDWLHVDDHNRGIELILRNGLLGETYNIGGNNEWANLDTVKLLCNIADKAFAGDPALKARFPQSPCARGSAAETLITFVKDRPGHDTRYAIDAGKLTRELGYEPRMTFDSGLASTVQWYLHNEPWWRGIQDQSYRY